MILTFEIDTQKKKAVEEIAGRMGQSCKAVTPAEYSNQLGYLAGIQGFAKQNVAKAKAQAMPTAGKPFPAEMLIFAGMDTSLVDKFLAEYKATGLAPIGLKAVVTQHNIFWTPQQLFQELLQEHMSFQR